MPSNSNKKSAFLKWLILLWILALGIYVFLLRVKGYLSSLPEIKNEAGRINFSLLGISGGDYTPPDLTDTVIIASYNQDNGRTAIFSLPRDLWIPSIEAKVNSAYHFGGLDLARRVLEEVTGQPIHYLFVVDFEGFKKAVDFLGGIKVTVERTFDDDKYPIAGKEKDECGGDKEYRCRYESVHFEKGIELMSGERALKFVRSRNAEGEEGTDMARSARQQRFLIALKNEILLPKVLLNPWKIKGLFEIFSSAVVTDLKKAEYLSFGLSFRKIDSLGIKSFVLGSLPVGEELFYNPKTHSSGQWVLTTKDKGWEGVRRWITRNIP